MQVAPPGGQIVAEFSTNACGAICLLNLLAIRCLQLWCRPMGPLCLWQCFNISSILIVLFMLLASELLNYLFHILCSPRHGVTVYVLKNFYPWSLNLVEKIWKRIIKEAGRSWSLETWGSLKFLSNQESKVPHLNFHS